MITFEKNILNQYGQEGEAWLKALPSLLSEISKQYGLSNVSPVSNMSHNYVAIAYQGDQAVVLKLGLDEKRLCQEAMALQVLKHHGAVELVASDNGMLLMQQALPGTTLKAYFPKEDKASTRIVCDAIKKLQAAPLSKKHSFSHIRELLVVLDHELSIPDKIVINAKQLATELLASATEEVFLHGDLHHDNIVKQGDHWLVIDPKGHVGDPAFEPAAYLCNPIPELMQHHSPKHILLERIRLFSELLDIPEKRILDWLTVKTVLCWAWTLEANADANYWKSLMVFMDCLQEDLK